MRLQTSPWKTIPFARLFALSVCALAPRGAHAQTLTETPGTAVIDYLPNGQPSNHPNGIDGTWISYDDCEADVVVAVAVDATQPKAGFSNYVVAAFATTITGVDCGVATNRSGAEGVCWQVGLSPGVVTTTPTVQSVYQIRVQDLLRDIGRPPGYGLAYVSGTEAACHATPPPGPVPLSLQFVVSDLGGNEVSNLELAFRVELVGPSSPTQLSVRPGDGQLTVTWAPVADPDVAGFFVFMDPMPGEAGGGDGGSCPSATFAASAGRPPTTPGPSIALSLAPAATSATITGLSNGVDYTLAISAADNLGDEGPLSVPVCGTPIAGGAGGGAGEVGGCAVGGTSAPSTGLGVAAVGLLLAWSRRRTRRPRGT
jgi:MYXO-CTERM domain-containing protein